MSTLDDLLSGGAKSFFNKDSLPGAWVTGIITEIEVRPATDYESKEPLFFPSGDPKEQIVVTVRAQGIIPTDEDDDLYRSIYIKGWGAQKRAFIDATRKAAKPEAGDRFTATYLRSEVSPRGGFPAKVFEYRIEPLSEGKEWSESHVAPRDEMKAAYEQARKLIGMGTFTDAQVAAATALPLDEVKAMSESTAVLMAKIGLVPVVLKMGDTKVIATPVEVDDGVLWELHGLVHGYVTLDCRDGVHGGCEVCDCECHEAQASR